MKDILLSGADRKACEDARHALQESFSEIPPLALRALGLAAILLVSLIGEYCLSYSVVFDALGPLPGEPWSPIPAIVALSGMIAVATFALYKRTHSSSFPVRFVGSLAGYAALSFIIVMGVMLAKLIYTNMSGGDVSATLFADTSGAADVSLLAHLFEQMTGPFALIFGLLTICNLYVAEYALSKLREALRSILERRALISAARAAMDEFEESERELARLDAERQDILQGLEPAAAYAFANKLSCVIAEARSPIEQWITAQQLRKKPAASVLGTNTEPDIDIARLKERVAALTLDAEVIYATFKGEKKGKQS